MAGYILQGKTAGGQMVDVPLAAKYDANGNQIDTHYATKAELAAVDNKANAAIGILTNVPFANASWATIGAISEMGYASQLWNVGDEKNITLTTGETITMVIMGFDHDDLTGGGKAGITLGMKNNLATNYSMNPTNSNAGGWTSSVMRTSTMQTLYGYLPDEVKAVIKAVDKKTSAGSQSSTINTTSDKLWLFSMIEVMGTINYNTTTQRSFAGEGTQYDYFKQAQIPSGFTALSGTTGTFYKTSASTYTNKFGESESTTANVYYNYNNAHATGNSGATAAHWWLRSPYSYNSTAFCFISNSGAAGNNYANVSTGVAFGFCV